MSFDTCYIFYIRRGMSIIYLKFPFHILAFKNIWRKESYEYDSLGLLEVNKKWPNLPFGDYRCIWSKEESDNRISCSFPKLSQNYSLHLFIKHFPGTPLQCWQRRSCSD